MNLEKILLERMSPKKRFLRKILTLFGSVSGIIWVIKWGASFRLLLSLYYPEFGPKNQREDSPYEVDGNRHWLLDDALGWSIQTYSPFKSHEIRPLMPSKALKDSYLIQQILLILDTYFHEAFSIERNIKRSAYSFIITLFLCDCNHLNSYVVLMSWSNVSVFIRMKLCRHQFRGWRFWEWLYFLGRWH